ncbi:MAG: hypothetical protein JW864_09265 [Spirochaetes bacterium]|nr:hypothetical protein [Spirochaetota bacterium]
MKKIYLSILIIVPLIFGTCFNDEGSSNVNAADTDGDGITDDIDNCVYVYNPDQSDIDDDGTGDVCEGGLQETLDNSYTGTLTLHYTNTIPFFDKTTSVSASVSDEGLILFGTGTLTYSGEYELAGQSKIKREGTLNLAPYGYLEEPDDIIYVVVNENTAYSDTYTQWIWNDDTSEWVLYSGTPITSTGVWNGGLTFVFEDAETTGSTVGTSTSMGSIMWTLTLTPDLVP